ncbi:MAG: universal stress protein [Actinobacteria bacterium]|nr:universal stress protein [Actinomycetota bacterium]
MKIVVGYVNTQEGKAALDWAVNEVKERGGHVVVVHSMRGGGNEQAEREEMLTYREEFDEIEKRLTDEGVPHTIRRLIRGLTPAEDLVRVVSEESADVIAIGLRRRSRTGKLIMGSDALEILLLADCPVVGIKRKETE